MCRHGQYVVNTGHCGHWRICSLVTRGQFPPKRLNLPSVDNCRHDMCGPSPVLLDMWGGRHVETTGAAQPGLAAVHCTGRHVSCIMYHVMSCHVMSCHLRGYPRRSPGWCGRGCRCRRRARAAAAPWRGRGSRRSAAGPPPGRG